MVREGGEASMENSIDDEKCAFFVYCSPSIPDIVL